MGNLIRFTAGKAALDALGPSIVGAYLIGADGVPIRAEIETDGGEIRCQKRAAGPAALCLLWNVEPFGTVMLESTRVIERDKPYVLPTELARGRLMRINQKREDWGLFDYPGADEIYERCEAAKARFISAMTAPNDEAALAAGNEAIRAAAEVGEELSLFHAGIFLERRRAASQFGSRPLGCRVTLAQSGDGYRAKLAQAFDFVVLPLNWASIEPKQGSAVWDQIDPWIAWAHKNRLAIRAAPLASFYRADLPDWVSRYEQDYDGLRDVLKAHVKRTVQRLGPYVHSWDVCSGLHAHNTFNFSFEQLIELTRMCATAVKQLAPRSTANIDLVAPWGEYYARNPRTIPPLLFAEMVVQSGIPFDAFGLQFHFGVPQDGMFMRDLMQISSMVDRFANLGKPLHITAVQVPSAAAPDPADHWNGQYSPAAAGSWRGKWSEAVQAEFLRRFLEVVLSKPFVETVTWRDLADTPGHYIPHGGLLRPNLSPKAAYDELLIIRNELFGGRKASSRSRG